jgi:arsenate reductase
VNKQRVLFLCTHNSARSQMAEGFLRSLAGDRFEVASAGTEATRVHPLAIRAMADISIDLSGHTSKIVEFVQQPWDYVITVCDAANEACLVFPKKSSRLHWSFEDPDQNSVELCGYRRNFRKSTGRFSTKALRPSMASGVW